MNTARVLAVCVGVIAVLGMMVPVHGAVGALLNPAGGKVWYVSAQAGNNSNPGTQQQPFKNIDKAIKVAQAGDTVAVAEGVYSGTFNIGYLAIDKPLKLYGSFARDFSARDIRRTPTLFQPDNASAATPGKPCSPSRAKLTGRWSTALSSTWASGTPTRRSRANRPGARRACCCCRRRKAPRPTPR